MRKGLLSTVATALVGTSAALAQGPAHLPSEGVAYPSGRVTGVPALLSADAAQTPAATQPAAPVMSGGSTGLCPGVDCLPAAAPRSPRFYSEFAYLWAVVRDTNAPGPLAIASPATGPNFTTNTITLIGGQKQEFDSVSGLRFLGGMWLGCDGKWGVEVGGIVLDKAEMTEAASGNAASPILLSSPFYDPIAQGLDFSPYAGAGLTGTLVARNTSQIWGAEANVVHNWRNECNRRTDLIGGFAYYDLREALYVDSISSLDVPGAGTFTNIIQDAYSARNQFYGPQVGARSTWTRGPLALTMTSKVAVGFTHEVVSRNGNSTLLDPAGSQFLVGGFLNQVSNIGIETKDRFSVAMPANMQVSYQVTEHLSAFIGYDFIFISNVARPNDQVDLTINPNFLNGTPVVGPLRPAGGVATTMYWANAISFGVMAQF